MMLRKEGARCCGDFGAVRAPWRRRRRRASHSPSCLAERMRITRVQAAHRYIGDGNKTTAWFILGMITMATSLVIFAF